MIIVQYNIHRKSGCTPEEKEKILAYMKNGSCFCASPSIRKDHFTNEPLPIFDYVLTDNKYLWKSEAIYYFEKYNCDLTEEFKQYVLS